MAKSKDDLPQTDVSKAFPSCTIRKINVEHRKPIYLFRDLGQFLNSVQEIKTVYAHHKYKGGDVKC